MKRFIIYILIIFVTLSLGAWLWQRYNHALAYKGKCECLESTITNLEQKIKLTEIRYSDSISLCQAEISKLYMTNKNLTARYGALLKASRIKPKDVSDITTVTSMTYDRDSIKGVANEFGGIKAGMSDKFVNIDIEILPDTTTIIEYEVRDSLTVLNLQKQHSWLFGLIKWKESKGVRIINHNPKATIVSAESIEIVTM